MLEWQNWLFYRLWSVMIFVFLYPRRQWVREEDLAKDLKLHSKQLRRTLRFFEEEKLVTRDHRREVNTFVVNVIHSCTCYLLLPLFHSYLVYLFLSYHIFCKTYHEDINCHEKLYQMAWYLCYLFKVGYILVYPIHRKLTTST